MKRTEKEDVHLYQIELEKYASCNETWKHIDEVRKLIGMFIKLLMARAQEHDKSKFSDEEIDIFAEYTPKLKKLKYGSDEYKQCLEEMKPALDHHYRYNRHHPECFDSYVGGMNLVDIVEMFFDWAAATKRMEGGDIFESIRLNQKRFGLSDQLVEILKNTAIFLDL